MRILIADDEPSCLHILQVKLTAWGHDVVTACNGVEAWEILQRADAPRFAILDWMMPGMNGVEVCRAVRQRTGAPYIYLLVLTAKIQPGDVVEAMEAGADDYVVKSFDSQELKARLHAGERILDLQAQLVSAHEALREQTMRDSLTGLWNRAAILDMLQRELTRAPREARPVAAIMADLDHFKRVNDTYGHAAGDAVLCEAARRMGAVVRAYDAVGRTGGEEFLIVLPGCDLDAAYRLAERLRGAVTGEPMSVGGTPLWITISLGVAAHDGSQPHSTDALISAADVALYQAKRSGRNRTEVHTVQLAGHEAARSAADLAPPPARAAERGPASSLWRPGPQPTPTEHAVRQALEREEFVLHYQPQVALATGHITGAEALIRWRYPDLGMVFPMQFIPQIEDTSFIAAVGQWVFEAACSQGRAWRTAGLPLVRMAVNLSARQLDDPGLPSQLEHVLQRTGFDPQQLEIEITETALLDGADAHLATLRHLRAMGIRIALDDFGTKYSSLAYLRRLPVDTLKVAQSFIQDISPDASDSSDTAIIVAILTMAQSLRLRSVAEGVETVFQREFLRRHHCDEFQGYLISQPLPADEFARLLGEGPGAANSTGPRAGF